MKLVATSDFKNTHPDKIEVDNALHPAHVHKGARFSIGGDLPIEKLAASDKMLVGQLNNSGRIVYETQTEAVKKIDEEVARAEESKEKPAKGGKKE